VQHRHGLVADDLGCAVPARGDRRTQPGEGGRREAVREREADGGGVRGPAADRGRRAGRHDLPCGQDHDPVGQRLGFVHVVRGQEDRLAEVAETGDHLPGGVPGGGVEPRGGLVQEDQLGVADQGQGHVETAQLTAGQPVTAVIGLVGQPDEFQRPPDGQRPRVVPGVHGQALPDGEPRLRRRLLQHHADPGPPARPGVGRVGSEHLHLAAGSLAEPLEDLDGGGLARAVGPEEGQNLTAGDIEVNAPHGLVVAVAHPQAPHGDHTLPAVRRGAGVAGAHARPDRSRGAGFRPDRRPGGLRHRRGTHRAPRSPRPPAGRYPGC